MSIQVFHNQDRGTRFMEAGDFPADYIKVATVDLPDERYAEAFGLTNSVHNGWWENEGVTAHTESEAFIDHEGARGTRSTSVGDVIVLSDGRVLACAMVGWEEIGNVVEEGLGLASSGGE